MISALLLAASMMLAGLDPAPPGPETAENRPIILAHGNHQRVERRQRNQQGRAGAPGQIGGLPPGAVLGGGGKFRSCDQVLSATSTAATITLPADTDCNVYGILYTTDASDFDAATDLSLIVDFVLGL